MVELEGVRVQSELLYQLARLEIIEEIFGLEEMTLDRGFAPQILIKN